MPLQQKEEDSNMAGDVEDVNQAPAQTAVESATNDIVQPEVEI